MANTINLAEIPAQQSLPSSRKVINSNFEIVNATINGVLNVVSEGEINNVSKVTVMNTNNPVTDATTIDTNGIIRANGGIRTSGSIEGASKVEITNGRDGLTSLSTSIGNTALGNLNSTHTFNGTIDLNGRTILGRRVYNGNAWDSLVNPSEVNISTQTRRIPVSNETVLNVSFSGYIEPTQSNPNTHINRFELGFPTEASAGQIYYVIVHIPENINFDVKLVVGGTIIIPLPRNASINGNEISIVNDMQPLQFMWMGTHWILMNAKEVM
jgi:hypothetical protein